MNVRPYLQKLSSYIEANDYAGYDPYDALNSPVLNLLSSRSKWAKLAFMQFLKRCPVNFRPLLGVRKGHNPKAIGLFLWGYAKLYKIDKNTGYLKKIEYLLSLIDSLKSQGYSGNCWGYNFDWQSRTFFRPKGTPTIVNSAFIGHALLDCYEYTGKQYALDMSASIKNFLLNDLHRTNLGDTFCFSYTPVDTAIVHNANLLGASLLIRLKRYCNDSGLEDAAMASLAYSMRHQHENGSWYYADTDIQQWSDSFHTGFNLQAIRYFLEEGFAGQYRQAYEKGVRFYADNFFLTDGTPKYYHNKIYPIDIHSAAQAIVFFSGTGDKYMSLTDRVLAWMLDNLYSNRGWFYFQKKKFYTNKTPYMRWNQAWVFHAFTSYLLNIDDKI